MPKFTRLDREHEERMRQLMRDNKRIDPSDVFHKSIASGLDQSKVILESYNLTRVLGAYPFSPQVYVGLCPICVAGASQRHLQDLLENQAIVPVLNDRYDSFDPKFVSMLLGYPHISLHEFSLYRYSVLFDKATALVCPHCVQEKRTSLMQYIKKKNLSARAIENVELVLSNLFPFVEPDFELLDEMESAISLRNAKRLDDIVAVSFAVRDARTDQAYGARSAVPAKVIPGLLHAAAGSRLDIAVSDFELVRDVLASDLHLEIPGDVDVAKYVSCIEPYRNELSGIVERIIDETRVSSKGSITTLAERLGDLSEQLKGLSKNKSYLAYRASVAFIHSNKAMIASTLLATALGLSGNAFGCGVSLASGIGLKVADRFGKLKVPQEVAAFGDEVKHALRPYIHKLVAKYLHLDVKAVQLWEFRERLRARPSPPREKEYKARERKIEKSQIRGI